MFDEDKRDDAIDDLTDEITDAIMAIVNSKGGDGRMLLRYMGSKEAIGVLMDGLLEAMPSDFGMTDTKE